MPIIDPQAEKSARDMLGHAIRGEVQELAPLIQSAGGRQYQQVLGLCLTAAAYIAVDVSGRWPTDADLREIARLVAERETEVRLNQEDVYGYLSAVALGFQPLTDEFGDNLAAAMLPVLVTGSMLVTFRPQDLKWWEYLEQIWNAYDAAERVDATVLPALQVRVRALKAIQAHEASQADGPGPD
jgi:hypothetical protein